MIRPASYKAYIFSRFFEFGLAGGTELLRLVLSCGGMGARKQRTGEVAHVLERAMSPSAMTQSATSAKVSARSAREGGFFLAGAERRFVVRLENELPRHYASRPLSSASLCLS